MNDQTSASPESQDNPSSVAFIGLGAMGFGMAHSLVKAGFDVCGFDVYPPAMERFAAAGGRTAPSALAAGKSVDAVILMVLNAQQVESTLFGETGLAAALSPNTLVMLCSTVQPSYVETLVARLAAHRLLLLDAPVSGGTARAAQGALSVMASGSTAAFAAAAPLLDALAERVYTMGEHPGQGSTMKMVNQVLAGIHIAAAAEALALGTRAGLDANDIYEVICNSAGASWMFENRVPHILQDDYTPHSAVEIWLKDLGLVIDTGKELHVPTPLAAAAQQLFVMAAAAGHSRLDDAAVVKVYEQLAGFRVVNPTANPTTEAEHTPHHPQAGVSSADG